MGKLQELVLKPLKFAHYNAMQTVVDIKVSPKPLSIPLLLKLLVLLR